MSKTLDEKLNELPAARRRRVKRRARELANVQITRFEFIFGGFTVKSTPDDNILVEIKFPVDAPDAPSRFTIASRIAGGILGWRNV